MQYFLTLFSALILLATTTYAGDLKTKLTDLRNNKNHITIVIHDNEASFKDNQANKAPCSMLFNGPGSKTLTLHALSVGINAISILHTKDITLDANKRDFPTESYTSSNKVGVVSTPSFKEIAFAHSTDTDTAQTNKMICIK